MSQTPAPNLTPCFTPVMQCPVAGFQLYDGESAWHFMMPKDPLVLRREPGNRHDPRAITVAWKDAMLGYVPREANYALSQMMDRGVRVEGRVASLRRGEDSWQRVMIEVAVVHARAPVEEPEPGPPAFEASDVLVLSLANRIFGAQAQGRACDWVRERAAALALVGVEHAEMLPFLRLVARHKVAASERDPLAALRELLRKGGIEDAAWTRLPHWGFGAFAALDPMLEPIPVARFANLLLRLDAQGRPPYAFAELALTIACYRREAPDARLDFERYPLWFMRAVLEGLERAKAARERDAMGASVRTCVDWLVDARPLPDANQQKAGWDWVLAQARAHAKARELAAAPDWSVPKVQMSVDEWLVIPIRSRVELAAEAAAMKNCLMEYEDDCRSGNLVVFSIRDGRSGKRHACFSVGREGPDAQWELEQVAGKMNADVSVELQDVASMAAGWMRELAGGGNSGAAGSRHEPG